jgi:hypothetical protein
MIRRFVAWLFGRIPDPGPLFPLDDACAETPAGGLADRQEAEDRMLEAIDAKLDEARAHLANRRRERET